MFGLKDFRIASDCKIDLFNLKVSDTGYTRKELIENLSRFKKFRDDFKCSTDEMLELIDDLCILDKHLFEYTIAKNDFKVGENLIYITKQVRVGYNYTVKDIYYDVYITSNQFVSLVLNKIAERLILKRFPFFLRPPFAKEEKRFKDSIKDFPTNPSTLINDLNRSMVFENDLTLDDIVKLCKDKSYANSSVVKTRLSVYADNPNSIYLKVDDDKDYSLYLTVDSLVNGDWKAVEEHDVFGVCLYDENDNLIKGQWFKGKQKDAPYFNSPIVKELKKILLGT